MAVVVVVVVVVVVDFLVVGFVVVSETDFSSVAEPLPRTEQRGNTILWARHILYTKHTLYMYMLSITDIHVTVTTQT